MLKQKSRGTWLDLGDGNNSFFFNQTKGNWNMNKIHSLQDKDGIMVHGHTKVASVAVDYFQDTIGTYNNDHVDLSGISYPKITPCQSASLTRPVNSDIIYATLKKMKPNKAPGPDGFNAEFYLNCWDIVGKDFCEAVNSFLAVTTCTKE